VLSKSAYPLIIAPQLRAARAMYASRAWGQHAAVRKQKALHFACFGRIVFSRLRIVWNTWLPFFSRNARGFFHLRVTGGFL
jgi:hypothetical protein